jgi:hypothetical protein
VLPAIPANPSSRVDCRLAGLGVATERPDLRTGRPAIPVIGARFGGAAVSDHKNDAFADTPPDWVALTEAVVWIQRSFGVDITERAPNLVRDLRKGTLRYHIAGLNSDDLYARAYGTYTAVPGLTYCPETRDVIVKDWQVAGVDWLTGTVTTRVRGIRRSYRIELWWLGLEEWAKPHIEILRTRAAQEPLGTTIERTSTGAGSCKADPPTHHVSPSVEQRPSDPWSKAVGAWVPLADLLVTIEKELGVPQADAARTLRHPLESYAVYTQVVGLNGPASSTRHSKWFAQGHPANSHHYCVSQEGWSHVDWSAGTLAGYRIEVRWAHVVEQLATLAAAVKRRRASEAEAVRRKGGGARNEADEVNIWMRAYVQGWNDVGRKPKREETLKLCSKEMKTTYRQAEIAWEALPTEWRNPPRVPKA